MNYPLQFSFKIIALAPQITVTDSTGQVISYVRQKMFKLREQIEIYSDTDKNQLLCQIQADRVMDFSATYRMTSADGGELGSVRRKGMRSIFKAHYEMVTLEGDVYTLREDNAWTKFFDSIFGSIPILGLFSGFVFHPSYTITNPQGSPCYRITKQPHMFEGKFTMEKIGEDNLDGLAYLAVLMMLLLERDRG